MAFDAKHRHFVFTIPWELRDYLIKHRELLDLLYLASRNTLACVFNDKNSKKQIEKIKSWNIVEHGNREVSTECPRCNHAMFKKIEYGTFSA